MKRMLFLGSSITYGAASGGVSFVEYIGQRNGIDVIKEAVSGTTLVNNGPSSYIARLEKLNRGEQVDLFVCQLSTNDAAQGLPLGQVSRDGTFDQNTVAGAIEHIISYAKDVWGCPVVFYTSPRFDSERYAAMVRLLHDIGAKWGITIIDMWNDEAFNAITPAQRVAYMADPVHPTAQGYLEWWTPYMERALLPLLGV